MSRLTLVLISLALIVASCQSGPDLCECAKLDSDVAVIGNLLAKQDPTNPQSAGLKNKNKLVQQCARKYDGYNNIKRRARKECSSFKSTFSDEEFRDIKDGVLSRFNPPGGSTIKEKWIKEIKARGYDEPEAVYIYKNYVLSAIKAGYDLDVIGALINDYQIDQNNKLLQQAPASEEGEIYDLVKAAYEEYSGKSSIIEKVTMQWSDGPFFGGLMILKGDIVLEWSSENGDSWSFNQE